MNFLVIKDIFHTEHDLYIIQSETIKNALSNFDLKEHSFDIDEELPQGIFAGIHFNKKVNYDLAIILNNNLSKNRKIAVLSHELIHAAYSIEIEHGEFFSKNAQESFCHFMESVMYKYICFLEK